MRKCEPCICDLSSYNLNIEQKIIDQVCLYFNINREKIMSKRQFRKTTEPRQMAMTLISYNSSLSLKDIGDLFGGRHHTTVVHSKNVVNNLIETDSKFKRAYKHLEKIILNEN